MFKELNLTKRVSEAQLLQCYQPSLCCITAQDDKLLSFFQSATEHLLSAINLLQKVPSSNEDDIQIIEDLTIPIPEATDPVEARRGAHLEVSTSTRHLHFLPINRQAVLTYAIRILLQARMQ